MEWNDHFMRIFKEGVERYHLTPTLIPDQFFLPDDVEFFETIGYKPSELYPYVKAYATEGYPSPSMALLIASVRRSFFITSQRNISGQMPTIFEPELPKEYEALQDIVYLPRILRKAEAKLHGNLDPNVMFYCPQDRKFLKDHGDIHPADFLTLIWNARGDKQRLIAMIQKAERLHKKSTVNQSHEG